MAYQVALINFEGPLDLLLQLIEKAEVEITNISLAELTNQYLKYIGQLEGLDPEELNGFLSVAAKLAYIKSLALLPQLSPEDAEEMADLGRQLGEYAKFQKAAEQLKRLLQLKEVAYQRSAPAPAFQPPQTSLELTQLQHTYQQLMAKLPKQSTVAMELITIEQATGRLRASLGQRPEMDLDELVGQAGDRQTALVFFLALLELLKNQAVNVIQEGQFQTIRIKACLS
ncbi:MAG TPA: ScpA family protein [Candidatus Nanoarchaeia archaeon]|nr:ScpA family protein [Candidatus Nanoarchaeia archaeon]